MITSFIVHYPDEEAPRRRDRSGWASTWATVEIPPAIALVNTGRLVGTKIGADVEAPIGPRLSASQAGRRRFESGLPLHVFSSLRAAAESVLHLCSVNLSIAANRLKMSVLFISHRAPLVGSAKDTTTAAFSHLSGLCKDCDCQRDWKPAL